MLPFIKNWDDIIENSHIKGLFDYVVCFELLEHLNEKNQNEVLEKIHGVLKENGTLIVSVPIEKGIPSMVKNMRRILIHYNSQIYHIKNVMASLFSCKTKWMEQHRRESHYLSHMGFFFNDLEKNIEKKFKIIKRSFCPFKRLGFQLNSQVFYTLKK